MPETTRSICPHEQNDGDHTCASHTTAEVTCGLLLRRQFRSELEKLKFLGHDIVWHESKGWIESNFTIRAHPTILRAIGRMITLWNA